MYYTHKKSGVTYKFIMGALFQNKEGVWVDCVIYENEEGMTFVRELPDWERSFTKREGVTRVIEDNRTPRFYKLLHVPTGLFYQPTKHRVGNLGTLGKVYSSRKPMIPTQIKLCGTYKKKLCKREQIIKNFFKFEGYQDRYVDTLMADWEVVKIY